ncbi:hypothetical protein ACFFQW_10100 [Umezawaea endophytica]|uniref:Uncharacterized protein n=1 Tax=Umezawaea endophytica TaxID=1654476 RepID=A0A9X3AFJ6_9PSEU|nr:hypothetical protein [Umezawaea endophytica]MCS7478366.1 hypothetical protein [Umezawaea endophytica]
MTRQQIERLATTIIFTILQVGATVVLLVQLNASGILAAAAALVMAGGLVAVHDAWREFRNTTSKDMTEERDLVNS